MTKTDHIKKILLQKGNFDLPAQKIADLLEEKGVIIDPQHVYQARSSMRAGKKGATRHSTTLF